MPPDVEIVTFETKVDKLCADWVLDIAKQLKQVRDAISARTKALGAAIAAVPVPKESDPKDVAELPARVNEILKENSVRLKGIVDVQFYMKMDVKARKLSHSGQSYAGHLTAL